MKITIIGCGYIGKAVAGQWRKKGHQITATTRKPEREEELKAVANYVYVIPKGGSLELAVAGADAVLLAVAADTRDAYATTYLKTSEALVKSLGKDAHLLYTGSTSVYGDHHGGWVTEETPLEPLNENSHILAQTEQVLLNGPAPCAIFRLGGIIGPGRDIIKRLQHMQGKVLPGKGERFLNLVHRDQVVRALDFALENRLKGIYNLCGDAHPCRKEHYDALCKQAGLPLFEWDASLPEPHPGDKRVSSEKLKRAGFQLG